MTNTAKRRRLGSSLMAISAAIFLSACTAGILDDVQQAITDAKGSGVGTPVIPSGSVITAHEALVIQFTDSIDLNSVALSGTIAATIPTPTLTTTAKANDTMTLNGGNAVVWTPGSAQTLVVNAKNPDGGSFTTLTLTYAVFKGMCVGSPATTPAVSDNGSFKFPYRSIQSGIDAAKTAYVDKGFGPAEVRVGTGTYSAACKYSGTYIVNAYEGISLYGGYASDFTTRNTSGGPSSIVDTDSSDLATFPGATHPVHFSGAITRATVFDGFSIQIGENSGSHCAIFCLGGASPTIRNVRIRGPGNGHVGNDTSTSGIILNPSNAQIEGCDIDPGWADISLSQTGQAFGIYVLGNSVPEIKSSTISGGHAYSSCGIFMFYSATPATQPVVSNNTVDGGIWNESDEGNGAKGVAIWLQSYSHPSITGNHLKLINSGVTTMYGVYEANANADPASLRSNYFDFSGNWYCDEGSTKITSGNYTTQAISTGEGSQLLFNATWGNTKN